MIVGISGHRPEKIPDQEWVRNALASTYGLLTVSRVYQGMASGVDLWSAKEAWLYKIPYVCVRPWAGHKPRIDDEIEYDKTLKHADSVVNVSPMLEYTGPWLYAKRNEWIVDSVQALIAVWDGSKSGTSHAVEYAFKTSKPVYQIDPAKREVVGWIGETVPF